MTVVEQRPACRRCTTDASAGRARASATTTSPTPRRRSRAAAARGTSSRTGRRASPRRRRSRAGCDAARQVAEPRVDQALRARGRAPPASRIGRRSSAHYNCGLQDLRPQLADDLDAIVDAHPRRGRARRPTSDACAPTFLLRRYLASTARRSARRARRRARARARRRRRRAERQRARRVADAVRRSAAASPTTSACAAAAADRRVCAPAGRRRRRSRSRRPPRSTRVCAPAPIVDPPAIVPPAIDELERIVGGAYRARRGRSLGGAARSTHRRSRVASALLTAFELTGRLPYSMLAEELMQPSRARRAGDDARRSSSTAKRRACSAGSPRCTTIADYRARRGDRRRTPTIAPTRRASCDARDRRARATRRRADAAAYGLALARTDVALTIESAARL